MGPDVARIEVAPLEDLDAGRPEIPWADDSSRGIVGDRIAAIGSIDIVLGEVDR